MNRYVVKLAFKGTLYKGWQRQPNGITVQQILEEALSMMLRADIRLTGAGRTDTGVHADQYYAHFDSGKKLSTDDLQGLTFKLNSYLPADISISSMFSVNQGFHARFTAKFRTYQYFIATVKNPFRYDVTHFMYGPIDIELMNKGASMLLETIDFTSFSKVNSDVRTNLCDVIHARWDKMDTELVFTITANRFLRNMVRAIVGTLLDLGTGKMDLKELQQVIKSKNRSNAGDSFPAKGLHLVRIEYPDSFNTG